MVSPTVAALDREISELHTRANEFRGRISSEVEEYRQKMTKQADDLDAQIKEMEGTRDQLRESEEAVEKMGQPVQP